MNELRAFILVADDTYPTTSFLYPTGIRLPEVLVRHLGDTDASFGDMDGCPGQVEVECDLIPADRTL